MTDSLFSDATGSRSEADIDLVASLETKIKDQDEDLTRRGDIFEQKIIELKSNHQKEVEGLQSKIKSLEISNMKLRQQQINELGRLKQDLIVLRETQTAMKITTGVEIQKATESITNSCETLREYVGEEVTESTASAEATINDLIVELEEYRNENASLKEKLNSLVSRDYTISVKECTEKSFEPLEQKAPNPSGKISWDEFTLLFRGAISGQSGKLPSEEQKLDAAGMLTVSDLLKELSFNIDKCQKTRDVELMAVKGNDSDDETFVDAFESH